MFAVVWSDEAFEEMSRLTRENPSRKKELSRALRELTDKLSRDPASAGESRWGEWRVMLPRPLTVYFRVDEDSRTVEIAQVRLTG